MFKQIIVAVDGSPTSNRGLKAAIGLASDQRATLSIVHVINDVASISYFGDMGYVPADYVDTLLDDLRRNGQKVLARAAATAKAGGVTAKTTLVETKGGSIADAILAQVRKVHADVIVMGTHGRRGLDRLVTGSTTESILRKSQSPVLAVHEPTRSFVSPESADEPVHLRKILCCVDFSEHSPRALEYAFSLGMQYQAEITLLNVLEDGKDTSEQKDRDAASMEQLIPEDARNWASITPLVLSGQPYEQIIEHAAEAQTDLIVMGVRGRNAVDLAVFGSTTHRVIQLGPCPVLVVRA